MLRAALAVLAVAAAGVLVACTGTSGGTSRPSSSVTQVWSIAQARAYYLADVAPSERDGAALVALGDKVTPTNWTKFRDFCASAAADENTLVRQLGAGEWPANVTQRVDVMIAALKAERVRFQSCAAAQSGVGVGAALSSPGSVRSAGNAVRTALGLPPIR